MNRTRINRQYEAAVVLMNDAIWADGGEVCMCGVCTDKRKDTVTAEAAKMCYPRIPFLPDMYLDKREFSYGKLGKLLLRLKNVRMRNEENTVYFANTKTHFCRRCGRVHAHEQTNKHRGKYYCSNCFDNMFVCADCGELGVKDKMYTKRCAHDQEVTEYVCDKCKVKISFCSNCGWGEDKKLMKRLAEGRNEVGEFNIVQVCRECYDSGLRTCDGCGKETHNSVCVIKRSKAFCPVCSEERQGIMGYDYKPLRPRFKKGKGEGKVTSSAFYMGWEIEIAPDSSFVSPDAMTHMVKNHVGTDKIYAMQDGSISQAANQEGIELACHPFTWEYYKSEGHKDWDKMCLFLKKNGWTGNYGGLGTHVHTTKAAWGTHQIYKLLKFVYNNQSFVQHVAERGPTTYCNYDALGRDQQKIIAKTKVNNRGDSHYNAINLNNGESGEASKTIEFRIFQSRLEPFNFHKNIEFAHACYEFTKAETRMTTTMFRRWLWKNRRPYPCLFSYLNLKESTCV